MLIAVNTWFLRSGEVGESRGKIRKSEKGNFSFQSQGKMRGSGKVVENQVLGCKS